MISRVEKQLKRRFAIGSQVSEHSIIQDFTKQVGGKRAALQFFVFFCFSMDVYYCWMILRGQKNDIFAQDVRETLALSITLAQ